MSSLTLPIDVRGPILQVLIGLSPQRQEILQKMNQPVPEYQAGLFLIDTGASNTCIDPDLLAPLGIPPKDIIKIQTPSTNGQPVECPVYDVNLIFAPTSVISVQPPSQFPYFRAISVAAAHLKSQGINGLLGRDVLDHCVLFYNGNSKNYTLAW